MFGTQKNFIPFRLYVYINWIPLLGDTGWHDDEKSLENLINSAYENRASSRFNPLYDAFQISLISREMIYFHGVDSFSSIFNLVYTLEMIEVDKEKTGQTYVKSPKIKFGFSHGDIVLEVLDIESLKQKEFNNFKEVARLPTFITSHFYGEKINEDQYDGINRLLTERGWEFNGESVLQSYKFDHKYLSISIDQI